MVAIRHLFVAVDAGDEARVEAIDEEEVDPAAEAIREIVAKASAERRLQAMERLNDLNETAAIVFVATPLVCAVGLILFATFWKILRNYQEDIDAANLQETENMRQRNEQEMALVTAALEAEKQSAQVREAMRATELAEAESLAKSDFLSRVSHELRTPLNAILGFGQILDREKLDPLAKESVGYILKGGRHLLDLINEILDITRVEAGRIEISLEPINLSAIVGEACSLMRPLAAERNIRLEENAFQLNEHYVMADHQRLKQVLLNLIANAIKYNREGGQVEISCALETQGRIAIAVHDTGFGIAPEDISKLFTPFERLNAARSQVEGTGLGLVLSQRLITAMGGTVTVESIVGRGSTFTIRLPQSGSPHTKVINAPDVVPFKTSRETDRTYAVLCIEDNPSNLHLIEVLLRRYPEITMLSAVQGSMGLDLARQHEPDLIFLDLNLPDMHGKEVLTRLQQSAQTREIPVVIISADATPNQIEQLLSVGAKDYLTKPLDVNQFLHTLEQFLKVSDESITPKA